MSKKLAHIGVAVENLRDAVQTFATIFGHEPAHFEDIPDQKVRAAIFEAGESSIELLEGITEDSPITKFIARRGPGIHHLCLRVEDIAAELNRLKKAGIQLIDDFPRKGAEGMLVAFVHPKATAGILIELQQLPE